MSDIAHNLLMRYYGCNEEFNAEKSVTIHDCSDQIKHNNQCSTEQELINVNRKDSSIKEIEDEESKTYCDKENSAINFQKVYSPAFNVEDLDNDMNLDKYDSFVELCITDEIAQNRRSSKERFTKDLDNGPDDTNEWCSMPVDDVLLDSASDISSVVTKRKPQKLSETSSTTSFIPKSKKTPVYNDVFVDLTDTGLAIFPMDVILQFCQLRMLYLENNNLSEIPSELFTSLRSLEWLDLRNNVIKTLPTTIKSHPSLHTLLLQHNKIEILPLELCLIPNLKTLQITDNPLIVPPKNVVTLGISSILNFLRMEWNRQYPDQIIEPKGNIELTSVIPSYDRSSCKQTRKRTSIVKFNNRNDKEIFKRKKEKHYRPNNRYSHLNKINDIAKVRNSNSTISYYNTYASTTVDLNASKKCSNCINVTKDESNLSRLKDRSILRSKNFEVRSEIELEDRLLQIDRPRTKIFYRKEQFEKFTANNKMYSTLCETSQPNSENLSSSNTKVLIKSIGRTQSFNYANDTNDVFHIITKDRKRIKIHPLNIKNPHFMLAFLENYLGITSN